MWDKHVQHAQAQENGSISISYVRKDENGINQTSLEVLKYTINEAYQNGKTSYIIKESVNETQETRYFELIPLSQQPNLWKVTFFAQLSPRILRTRGRDFYRMLGSLRTYIESMHSSN